MKPIPDRLAIGLERTWAGWREARRSHGNTEARFLLAFPVQRHWGSRVAFYLYLGATGAGFVFLEVLLRWLGLIGEATAGWGMWLGIALALLSILAIFDHLGPVARWSFYFAFRRPRRSWISRGVYIVTVLVVLRLLVALPTLPGAAGLAWAEGTVAGEVLRVLVLVFALAFMTYSGLVISSWNAIAFWNSPLVPLLFVGFSFVGGMAALPVIALLVEGQAAMEDVVLVASPVVMALLAGNGFVLALYLHGMSTATRPGRAAVQLLLRGSVRRQFVGGVVVVGLVLPAFLVGLDLLGWPGPGTSAAAQVVGAAAAIQVGGYLLRDSILRAGVYGPPV